MATSKKNVHVSTLVSLADFEFIPGNEGHCPIAAALRINDDDILSPRVTDKKISFSRRSTGQRYDYRTPLAAARFIHAVDAILETQVVPPDFHLVLTEDDLIRVHDRGHSSPQAALQQAHQRNDLVRVQEG